MFKNKLIKNGFLYILGGFLLQGINFLTLPIFTRLLSVEDFGMISIYNTWLSICSIFICFQSYGSIGNAKIIYSEDEFEEYTSNLVLLSTLIFIFWIIIYFIFNKKIAFLLKFSVNIILIMLIQSFFNTIIILKTTIYIYSQKAKEKLAISFINILLNILFSILFIEYMNQPAYVGRILGGAVPTILLGVYFSISIAKKKIPKFNKKHWKFCMSLTLPIVCHSLSNIVLGTSDRLMLEKFKGFYETGLYSLIYSFGIIISLIWGSLNSAWVPWYYENMRKKNHILIKNYSQNYLKVFTIICVVFLMLSPEILKIMAPKIYWTGLSFLPLIVGGYYFNFLYSFPVNYEFYSKKTKYIGLATTGAAIINVLLNLYFIPLYGERGAALTTLIAYICMFLFHEIITRVKFKYSILNKKDYLKEILKIILFIGIYYVFLNNIFVRYGLLAIYLGVFVFLFYKSLRNN